VVQAKLSACHSGVWPADYHTIGVVDHSASASEHLCRHDAESRKLAGHGTEPSTCTPQASTRSLRPSSSPVRAVHEALRLAIGVGDARPGEAGGRQLHRSLPRPAPFGPCLPKPGGGGRHVAGSERPTNQSDLEVRTKEGSTSARVSASAPVSAGGPTLAEHLSLGRHLLPLPGAAVRRSEGRLAS